jgi:hypothetical protein
MHSKGGYKLSPVEKFIEWFSKWRRVIFNYLKINRFVPHGTKMKLVFQHCGCDCVPLKVPSVLLESAETRMKKEGNESV